MAAYQFYNPAPVIADLLGLQPTANGFLHFYEAGTTTNKNTWSDSGLTTLNANPVPLGPDGRSTTAIFCDGEYTVVCKTSLGATVWTREQISPSAGGTSIPALETGQFLSNDGTNLLWQEISQLPDPTGSTSHYLTTDGTNWILAPIPDPPDPEVVVGADSFRAGTSDDATKFLIQQGNSTITASGTTNASKTITFSTAYSTAPVVMAIPTSNSHAGGPIVFELSSAPSTTAFTVRADIAEGSSSAQNITNDIPFAWVAFGTKEIP